MDYTCFVFICGIMSLVVGQSIDGKPGDINSCVGKDIEIPWNFIEEAKLNIATWSVTSSSYTGNILRKFGAADAGVINGYNVIHNGNGNITLTSVMTNNSGTFKLSVSYSSGPAPEDDSVEITVSESPNATLRYEDGSCKFDGGTIQGLVVSEEVNGTRKYCCVTGAAAACIDGSTETKYCIEVATTTTPSPGNTTSNCTECICDCDWHRILWPSLSVPFSFASIIWTLFVILEGSKTKKWLIKHLGKQAHRCMIGWVVVSLVYSIVAVILFYVLVCENDCCEEVSDCVCNCWPVYIIIGYVVLGVDVIVDIIGVIAFVTDDKDDDDDENPQHGMSNKKRDRTGATSNTVPMSGAHVHATNQPNDAKHKEAMGSHRQQPLPPVGGQKGHERGMSANFGGNNGAVESNRLPPLSDRSEETDLKKKKKKKKKNKEEREQD